jgi:hypothetical protein
LIASGAVELSKWVKALKGTAFAGDELLAAFDVLVAVVAVAPTPELRAFSGGVRTPDDGVSSAVAVSAFDPAAEDPEDAKEEDAPDPVAPEEALAWIYIF